MCGITGFTHARWTPNSNHIRNATRSLIHRGPDQQRIHQSPHISLGAVRLKIIDLVGGDQPMFSNDGNLVVVFNGEIYNHAELRRELISKGCHFESNSDTEVILHAFREWDLDCFRRFRGMFAIAVWNESLRRLVLARDRLGIKPLFYLQSAGDILFGSEIKAILQHPSVKRNVNPDALNCYLSLNYVPAPHTMVEGIQKLQPGHVLDWIDETFVIMPFWSQPYGDRRQWALEDAKQNLDSLLRESVREHLVSDVPVGIWTSGGLDSSTILHYTAESGAHLKTFSITFQGRSFDESRYIHEVSKHYGTEHFEFDLNTSVDLASSIEQFAYYLDEPCADAGALPVWFLSKMSRKHVTVALSGEGSDELFGGYVTYLADRYARWARRMPRVLLETGGTLAEQLPVSDEKISVEYKLKRFLKGSLLPPDEAHIFWNGAFADEEKSRLMLRPDSKPLQELLAQLPEYDGIGRALAFDLQFYLPDDILCKVDRMSMAHSLEVRPPFLDHRICEFALSLPDDFKIRRSRLKFVLRELMKGKLPSSILRRKKVGFDIPAHEWLRGPLKSLLLDTLTKQAIKRTNLLRWESVEALLKAHLDRRANWGYQLWGLMILVLWINKWQMHAGRSLSSSSLQRYSSAASTVPHI